MKLILSIVLFLALSFAPAEAHAFVGMAIAAAAGAAFGAMYGITVSVAGMQLFAVGIGMAGALAGAATGAVLGGLASLGKLFAPDVPEVGYDSPTYSGNQPNVTVEEGSPVGKPYGFGILGGNIIRQNDVKEADYIKLIVAHGQGEMDSFLGAWVNDVEWTDLENANHAKWTHTGAADQSGVTNLFSDGEACNYRGLAVTEVKLKKGDEVPQLQNFLTVARWKKCLNIGQDAGGTTSWTHDPAQVLWDWYITVEGYALAGLNTNAFTALSTYCATLQTSDESMPFRVPIPSDDLVKEASRTDNKRFKAKYGLKFDKSLVDAPDWNSWREQATVEKRINIDFGRPVVITKMVLENYHSTGDEVDVGINAFIVQGSNNAASLADTSYASTGWTDLLSTSAAAHTASNVVDPETFAITNSTAYRYYALKVATNQGDATYMGLRDLTFYGHTPRFTFDYVFDAKITINDAKKILWASFNGKAVMSQGKIKPVWDAAEEHDGAGALQTKAVSHTFTMDNTVKGSFVWGRLNNPNIIRVYYLNSAENFKKDVVEIKDEQDIARRGEVIFEDNCWFIVDTATAIRRAKLKFNKSRYTGWMCELTGWPDAQDLEEYDRVAVTNTLPGWVDKDFIVVQKDEDQWGRPRFYLEEYISGVYSDEGFELQEGVRSNLPNVYQPSYHPIDVAASYNAVSADKYSTGTVSITFTPPSNPYYSHSRILLSTDDSTYYYVGNSSGSGSFEFNGMGVLYQPGDTLYVKVQTVNVNGIMEIVPAAYDISCLIGGSIRIAGFYFGTEDMWGGNAAIGNAATVVVIGDLDGTPKIALGPSADAITFAGTETGFIVDGAGNVRFGSATHGLKFTAGTGVLEVSSKVRVGAGTYIDIDGANARIRSSDYVSGALGAGFTLEPGLLEVGNAAIRGILRTAVFQKDVISVVGGSVLVMPGDVLAADMTAADNSALTIEGNETFSVGDILRIKNELDDEWLEVTNIGSAPTYVVTRDLAAGYAANTNPIWTKGATVVNFQQSGSGGIYLTSSETNAPYISVVDHVGSPWSAMTTRLRIGNLNGFLGYVTDLYGIAIGAAEDYLKYDPTNGLRIKGSITVTGGDAFVKGTDTLDDITDGASYGRVALTAITGGKILLTSDGVSGTLPTALSAAKCTNALADQTSANTAAAIAGQGALATLSSANWQTQVAGTGKPVDNADVTGSNTAADTALVNGIAASIVAGWRYAATTYIDGGDIYTGTVTAAAIYAVTLSSITANLGTITAGNITLDSSGFICTAGKTAYADTDAGFWLGYDSGAYKFNIGDATDYLKWTGTILDSKGLVTIKTGTYTGDGTTSQAITGVGFQPNFLLVSRRASEAASIPVFYKATPNWGTKCVQIDAGQSHDNKIISLDADGFTVDDDGSDAHPNASGVTYDYTCFQ